MKNSLTFFALPFLDKTHRDFFDEVSREIGSADPATLAAIYLLSTLPETRTAFWTMVDIDGNIKNNCWNASWQTKETRRLTGLAVNLCVGDGHKALSPAQLFHTPLRPILWAAIQYWLDNTVAA
jgi:hypothetical protein